MNNYKIKINIQISEETETTSEDLVNYKHTESECLCNDWGHFQSAYLRRILTESEFRVIRKIRNDELMPDPLF